VFSGFQSGCTAGPGGSPASSSPTQGLCALRGCGSESESKLRLVMCGICFLAFFTLMPSTHRSDPLNGGSSTAGWERRWQVRAPRPRDGHRGPTTRDLLCPLLSSAANCEVLGRSTAVLPDGSDTHRVSPLESPACFQTQNSTNGTRIQRQPPAPCPAGLLESPQGEEALERPLNEGNSPQGPEGPGQGLICWPQSQGWG
jgi:hypothetical protein